MSRSTSTLIYWIRRYLAQFLAQKAKIMATFITSSLVLWLALSSQLGWAAGNNAASAANRDGQRSDDLTMQALAAAAEPTEVVWLETVDQPFLSLYRPAVDAAQMAIILLPGQLHHMADGGLLQTLYRELPIAGWSALQVALPAQLNQHVNGLDNDARHQRAINRTNQAVSHMMAQGAGSTALIAGNLSAQVAIDIAIARSEITSGLVLCQLDQLPLSSDKLQQLARSQITLLDILPVGLTEQDKINRRRQFQLAGFGQNYRQITAPDGRASIRYNSRRIQEWVATEFLK